MALPYFFSEDISAETQLVLSEETSKHCIQVLRMQRGEKLVLTNGRGTILTASILEPDRKHCVVKAEARSQQPASSKKIIIATSLLKNTSRFEWFLEKATEIGISEIIPLLCTRTEKQYFRAERMNQIVISSMLQSAQAWLPELQQPMRFEKLVAQSKHGTRLIAHCEEEKKYELKQINKSTENIILIGPEGDFTHDEIKMALANDFQPVTMGATRLRTETAGVVAAALLKYS